MCPDPHLGSWNCLPHQAHIALSEPMSSTDKQGSSLGSFPTFPSPLSPLLSAFGLLTLCQVVSGGRQRQIHGVLPAFILGSVLLCPVVGRSRPAVVACCTVRSGVFHHWIHHLWPQGAFPPGFNPLRRGWVYRPAPEAPRKGECRRGPRHFWNCLSRWATALRQDPP